jgi:hypothetical protein
MAYYETIKLVAGDTKPSLEFTIRDSTVAAAGKTLNADDPTTWELVNLTGSTVMFKFRALGDDVFSAIECIIHDQASYIGQCVMNWAPTTLAVEAGTYEGEVEVTSAGGTQTVFDKLKFKVRDDF